jgi:hypothetical protein
MSAGLITPIEAYNCNGTSQRKMMIKIRLLCTEIKIIIDYNFDFGAK